MIKKFVVSTLWMLLMIIISGMIFVRVAPHDIATVHVPPPIEDKPDAPMMVENFSLIERKIKGPPATVLEIANTVALQTPRTHILAGSAEEGMITYVTRSLVFGFPDYTTIRAEPDGQGSRVTIHARQRFGTLDFGVNSYRVRLWLSALEALDQAG